MHNLWYNKPVARVHSVGEIQMKFQIGDLFYIELFDRKLKRINGVKQMQYEDILRETKTLCIIGSEYLGSAFKLQYGNGDVIYLPEKYLESFFEQPRLYEKWTYYPVNT